MTAKERQAQREKFIRRYVRAKGLTPQQADRARKLSDENILREYGIKLPQRKKRIPQIKTPTKRQIARYERERAKFQKAVELGWDPRIALKFKRVRWEDIKAPGKWQPEPEDDGIGGIFPDPWFIGFGQKTLEQSAKEERWAKWAKDKAYPSRIKTLARTVNRLKGFDENARWGYAVIYNAYILDGDVTELMEILQPDMRDPDKYADRRLQAR